MPGTSKNSEMAQELSAAVIPIYGAFQSFLFELSHFNSHRATQLTSVVLPVKLMCDFGNALD